MNLRDHQLKISTCTSLNVNFMVITKLKLTTSYKHIKKKESICNTEESYQIIKEESKRSTLPAPIPPPIKLQEQLENNQQHGSDYMTMNNYFKCKWTKYPN